jgi:alginate O-acetyltransferase complex protein AlgI
VGSGGILFQAGCYALLFLTCIVVFAKAHSRVVRQAVLLTSSIALYLTWAPWFSGVLATSIVINFLFGKWLRAQPHWLPLSLGIASNLLLLGAFKYAPETAAHILPASFEEFGRIALPLGISFWTFQAMSYLFDLYREEDLNATFAEFALYMVFFPVTISGPVCRMPDMLPQFRSERSTPWSDITQGLRRVAIGIFMMQLGKLLGQGILAGDGIASGFDHATQWSGADVWCLAFGYGLQLFLDFAGYTHMAVGASRALGITVPENFERPFASTNPSEFWARWHMSLSFWIRDYVFFPLATLRREMWWRHLTLVLSMIVFGLWHKATLLFLIWGGYQGLLLVAHRLWQQIGRRFDWQPLRIWSFLGWFITAALISLGWIFFRANSLAQVREMLRALASPETYGSHLLTSSFYLLIAVLAAGYGIVLLVSDAVNRNISEATRERSGFLRLMARSRWFWLPAIYALALLVLLMITLTQQGGVGQMMYRSF